MKPDGTLVTITEVIKSWDKTAYYKSQVTAAQKENASNFITLTQEELWLHGYSDELWWSPVLIYTEKGSQVFWIPPHVHVQKNRTIEWYNNNIYSQEDWLVVVPANDKMYEIKYDNELAVKIISQWKLNATSIHWTAKTSIFSEIFLNAKDNYTNWLNFKIFLEMTLLARNETDTNFLFTVVSVVKQLYLDLRSDKLVMKSLRRWFGPLLNNVLSVIGLYSNIDEELKVYQARLEILDLCADLEVELCLELSRIKVLETVEMHGNFSDDFNSYDVCAGMRGTLKENERDDALIFDYVHESVYGLVGEKSMQGIMVAESLACTRNQTLLLKLLSDQMSVANHTNRMPHWKNMLQKAFQFGSIELMEFVMEIWLNQTLDGHLSEKEFVNIFLEMDDPYRSLHITSLSEVETVSNAVNIS